MSFIELELFYFVQVVSFGGRRINSNNTHESNQTDAQKSNELMMKIMKITFSAVLFFSSVAESKTKAAV